MSFAGSLTTTVSLLGVSWCHCCRTWGTGEMHPPHHQSEVKGPREPSRGSEAPVHPRRRRQGRRLGPTPPRPAHPTHNSVGTLLCLEPCVAGSPRPQEKGSSSCMWPASSLYSGPNRLAAPAHRHKLNRLQPHSKPLSCQSLGTSNGLLGCHTGQFTHRVALNERLL